MTDEKDFLDQALIAFAHQFPHDIAAANAAYMLDERRTLYARMFPAQEQAKATETPADDSLVERLVAIYEANDNKPYACVQTILSELSAMGVEVLPSDETVEDLALETFVNHANDDEDGAIKVAHAVLRQCHDFVAPILAANKATIEALQRTCRTLEETIDLRDTRIAELESRPDVAEVLRRVRECISGIQTHFVGADNIRREHNAKGTVKDALRYIDDELAKLDTINAVSNKEQ